MEASQLIYLCYYNHLQHGSSSCELKLGAQFHSSLLLPVSNTVPSQSSLLRWCPVPGGCFTLDTYGFAELWAIHEGLLHAWSLGLERLQCQTDCAEAFHLITYSNANSSSLTLVRAISRLASRAWMVDFCLIRRVANETADSISRIPISSDGSTFIISEAPPEISFCLLRDISIVNLIS
ncbi:hypothetical protein V6N11_053659 [Hibiscus sabdariffa]|uniref:Uncharacterized protein n=2 Tax=Hibiscus sabdariffa TaxID=183260 RepID=A0ABR2BWA9_9ROSI